jgi:acetyltransferase-like isoleucine patch superfamily enzyme
MSLIYKAYYFVWAKIIKKLLLKLLLSNKSFKDKYISEKWYGLPVSLFVVNFIFQRILLVNGDCPFQVHFTSKVVAGEKIKLGKVAQMSVAANPNMYLHGCNGIVIGDNTHIAPGVQVISSNHDTSDLEKPTKNHPIQIGNNSWLAANVLIMPSVQLGDNTIVAAGAVVTKSFLEGNVLLAGVPAKVIKKLNLKEKT